MVNVRKNITKEHNNDSKILFWHCLAIIALIGVRDQFQYPFRLLTNENIIFIYDIVRL